MGESLQDRTIGNDRIRSAAPPDYRLKAETIGFDLSQSPFPSSSLGGRTRAAILGMGPTMRGPVVRELSWSPAAGQFSDLAGLPCEHGASESLLEWKAAPSLDQPPFICLLFSFAANRVESLVHAVGRGLWRADDSSCRNFGKGEMP